jgi:small subunit ribosomal protein S18
MSDYRMAGRTRSRRPRFCAYCAEGKPIDYKDSDALRRYMSGLGKIKPRRQTGLCAKHQRELAMAIKRARHLALLSFTGTE